MSDDIYEIYAIRYGHHDRRRTENFLGGDPHDAPMPLDYYVWVIRNEARTYVLDTGFNERSAAARGRDMVYPVRDGLQAIGVDAEKVEDVIISHLHYDHAGNVPLFPKARVHVQEREMEFATGRSMCHPMMRHSFEADDVSALIYRLYEGRVQFHDGASELAPGLSIHFIGGHTKGLQSVRVKTRRGYVVLTSDASHFYAHFLERRVFPTVYNVADVLDGYNKLAALASSDRHVIPGHDPLVMALYPAASGNLKGHVVRLDLDPKPLPGA
jgi:glyoxylase-like metal-dependent hydrolase (beta-lactamase superfamily II)